MRDEELAGSSASTSAEPTLGEDASLASGHRVHRGAFYAADGRGRYVRDLTASVFAAYWADDLMGLAAEMAYNYLFALFPFFLFLAALLGFVGTRIGHADLFTLVMTFIAVLGPEEIQDLVRGWVHAVVDTESPGLLTLGAGLSLLGSTAGISTLAKGLDRAHKSKTGRNFWVGLLIALLATLSLHTVMLSGFLTYALGEWLLDRVAAGYGLSGDVHTTLDMLRGPAITAGLFAVLTVLYWALPTTRVRVAYAAAGALFATVAWTAITRGFGIYLLYLGHFSGTYGAFAAGIVLMVWMYGVSTVLLIGAEISAYPIRGRSSTR